jgi:DedD protein
MAFWNKTPDANNLADAQDELENSQHALTQARRRLLGAAVLLVIACSFIPWMLDSTPRPWGEDVILRMPKTEQPYQAQPSVAAPAPVVAAPIEAGEKPTAKDKP